MRRSILVVCTIVLVPRDAQAQGDPRGPEFRVNTYTTAHQMYQSVASDSVGTFLVVWQSQQDGASFGIFGQRYAASGAPLGSEFRVNTYTAGGQYHPAVVSDGSGNFVVSWESPDGSSYGIFGQRYDSSGLPLGGEFRVNTDVTDQQASPSMASDPSGNFVVVWDSFRGSNAWDIHGQRYASTGAPLGTEFQINTYTSQNQIAPSVAPDLSGGFVVVWMSQLQDGSNAGVFGRRFDSSGLPLGPEFRVNTYTTDAQSYPSIAADGTGNFIVAWRSYAQDGSDFGVFAQRYASSGAPLGFEFRVNTYTTEEQSFPTIAADSSGNFVFVWESWTQDGSGPGIFGQRYAFSGAPEGPEFRINTDTFLNQQRPVVSADAAGDFIVTWFSPDGSLLGVFGQRYGRIVPVELIHIRVE